MQTRYIGPRSIYLRPICRGGYYNKGEGIQMALDIGAAPCGDFGSYHAEPIDPRSGMAEPSVFIFPYGILVNKEGRRFTDEAPGTVDACYERVTRRIYEQTERHRLRDARRASQDDAELPARRSGPTSRRSPRRRIEALADKLGIAGRRAVAETVGATTRLSRRRRSSRSCSTVSRPPASRRRSPTGRIRSTSRRFTRIRSSRPTCSPSAGSRSTSTAAC